MGKCSQKVNFQAMKMGLVPKCSEEHSAVRAQGLGSGVRGQGSKQGSNFKIWGYFELFSRLHQLVTPVDTSDP